MQIIFRDNNSEKLKDGEKRASYPKPFKIRIFVLDKALEVVKNNPWNQEINIEENQKQINQAVNKFVPKESVASNNTNKPKSAEDSDDEDATNIPPQTPVDNSSSTKDGMDVNFLRDKIKGLHNAE